jgi:hypothetical protein
MDWRLKRKGACFGIAYRLDADQTITYRQLPIARDKQELASIDLSEYDVAEDEVVSLTQWYRPNWDERNLLEKSLEEPIELPDGRTRLVLSPAKLKIGYVATLLQDWTFTDDAGTKLTREQIVEQHAVVLDIHIQLFALDLGKL